MFVEIRNLKIYYETIGTNPNEIFLLLHGWGTNSQSLRPILTYLKAFQNATIYSLDLPGFGLSETPQSGWFVEDYANLIVEFMNKMSLQQVHLVAHSFGGRISIKVANRIPDRIRLLILISSAGILPRKTISYYLKIYLMKLTRQISKLLPAYWDKLLSDKAFLTFASDDYRETVGVMRQTFVNVVNEDLTRYLPNIKAQTLLIWGRLDKAVPISDARLMNDLIPRSTLAIIENAGHYSYLERPKEFQTTLGNFLQKQL